MNKCVKTLAIGVYLLDGIGGFYISFNESLWKGRWLDPDGNRTNDAVRLNLYFNSIEEAEEAYALYLLKESVR